MGRWELFTEGYWHPVPDNAQAVVSMNSNERFLCHKNPMVYDRTNRVRWNPDAEYESEPDLG